MRLNETEMVKLLPAWMQEDGSDKGLATGCDIISRDAYARLKLLSRWDKIDQLNDAELDEMAWELNIQWYDSTAPIAVKRAVIRSSDRVYAKLGTPYAVEQIVADYFGTGEVREWYQYGGQPHHFKVLSDNPSLVNSNLDLFLKLLRTVKRRSSWLDAILICLTGEMFLIPAWPSGITPKRCTSWAATRSTSTTRPSSTTTTARPSASAPTRRSSQTKERR